MKKLFLFLFLFNFYKTDSIYNFSKNYLNKASGYLFRNKFKSLGLGIISIYLGYKIFSGYKKSSKNGSEKKKSFENDRDINKGKDTLESGMKNTNNPKSELIKKIDENKNQQNNQNLFENNKNLETENSNNLKSELVQKPDSDNDKNQENNEILKILENKNLNDFNENNKKITEKGPIKLTEETILNFKDKTLEKNFSKLSENIKNVAFSINIPGIDSISENDMKKECNFEFPEELNEFDSENFEKLIKYYNILNNILKKSIYFKKEEYPQVNLNRNQKRAKNKLKDNSNLENLENKKYIYVLKTKEIKEKLKKENINLYLTNMLLALNKYFNEKNIKLKTEDIDIGGNYIVFNGEDMPYDEILGISENRKIIVYSRELQK